MENSVEFSYCPNDGCGKILGVGPNDEAHWCDECCEAFDPLEVRVASLWRKMSLAERAAQIDQHGEETIERFRLSEVQYRGALEMIESRKSARVLFVGDVSPAKATLPSLARTISDGGALREMIDNALDSAQKKELGTPVSVSVRFNTTDGSVVVRDNAGGMNGEDLLRCLRLGASQKEHDENIIGRFGVGAKEAIYHFGREVIIRTRQIGAPEGLRVEVPESWLDTPDWNVEIQAADDVQEGSTEIRIGALVKFDFPLREQIMPELWDTYRRRIDSRLLSILIDGREITGAEDPELLFPPEIYPRKYAFEAAGVSVELNVCTLRDAPDQSGIYFYAFGRRYAHWFWNDPKAKMIFDKVPQHKLNTHFRIDIDFSGRIDDVPINANKDEVDTNARVFPAMAKIVKRLCEPYLGCISFLSGEGMMRYIDQFAGPKRAHPAAKVDEAPFVIGKVYDGMLLDKKVRADVERFKGAILTDIRKAEEKNREEIRNIGSAVVVPSGRVSEIERGASTEYHEPGSYELPRLAEPPQVAKPAPAAVLRVKFEPSDIDQFLAKRLRGEFKKISEKLNVQLEFLD